MPVQDIIYNNSITWHRLKNEDDSPYKWGDRKRMRVDPNWEKRNVIYRWIKNSSQEIAMIGETEQMLVGRLRIYLYARARVEHDPNKKIYEEQRRLESEEDYLYLEFTDCVPGYNLNDTRERRWAEKLLTGYTKPYLQ